MLCVLCSAFLHLVFSTHLTAGNSVSCSLPRIIAQLPAATHGRSCNASAWGMRPSRDGRGWRGYYRSLTGPRPGDAIRGFTYRKTGIHPIPRESHLIHVYGMRLADSPSQTSNCRYLPPFVAAEKAAVSICHKATTRIYVITYTRPKLHDTKRPTDTNLGDFHTVCGSCDCGYRRRSRSVSQRE